MDKNRENIISETKASDNQEIASMQGNEVEHVHKNNVQDQKPNSLPQAVPGAPNQYQFANYGPIQPISSIPKNGGDQFISGLNNPLPFNSPMKQSVFDFDEERNDEESICAASRVKRSDRTKSQQPAVHHSFDEIKASERQNLAIAKNIDINIELEANSSGSDDAFYDYNHYQGNKANLENSRRGEIISPQQSAGLLQKRSSSEKREIPQGRSTRKSDSSRQERDNSKSNESPQQVGSKMNEISSSKKSGQNISQIMPVKSAQDKIEMFEQQEFLENKTQVRQIKSPCQATGSPKSVSELSSPDKSQSLSDEKETIVKSNEISNKRQKIDEENRQQEDIRMTQSDQQYLEEIQATYNTDIKTLIMEDIREQNQILSDLNLYKLQTLKKAISNYERSLPQNMLYKISTKINDFYTLIDNQADKFYQKYAENHQGKEKDMDIDKDNSLYLQDNFLADKSKFFDENIPIMRQIDEEITLDNGIIQFSWEPADKFRAKLYQLDSDGRWHDLGTGYFSIEYKSEGFYQMVLIGEQNRFHNLLENEVIEQRISFHRQRETIITWSDKEREQDLAISFQNNQGALYTWHKICMIIGCDPEQNSQDSQINQQEEDYFINVSYETIPKMAEELRGVGCIESQNRNQIADHFLESDGLNLQKLGELFEECEKEDVNTEKIDRQSYLQCFFAIYKGLLLLNDQRLLEVLMTDRFYIHSFGALEWDPDALVYDENYKGKAPKDQETAKQLEDKIDEEQKGASQTSPAGNANEKASEDDDCTSLLLRIEQREKEQAEFHIRKNEKRLCNQGHEMKYRVENEIDYEIRQGQSCCLNCGQTIEMKEGAYNCQICGEDFHYECPSINNLTDYKTKTTLNYRQFLTKIVKFKKVIPLSYEKKTGEEKESQKTYSLYDNLEIKSNNGSLSQGEPVQEDINNESATQGTQGGHTQAANTLNSSYTIEERIHINYRLQFLKDTVMARYIDDQSVGAISQLVMQNNTKIVQFIFDEDLNGDPYQDMISLKNSGLGNRRELRVSLKDQIIEKIQEKEDMNIKAMAIEFMIELCQILKSLQYQQSVGNASNFIYGNGASGGMANKTLYDQLYQPNFIGILAETFSIFTPNKRSLGLHLKLEEENNEQNSKQLVQYYQQNNEMEPEIIKDMIEVQTNNQMMDQITKLDQMKVNSMEIIISFQTSIHVPISNINSFVMGNSQSQKGYPFFDHLVQHMIYTPEQGLKIQIADFFKAMFDIEISQLSSPQNRETLYREILEKFFIFLKEFQEDYNETKENSNNQKIFKHYEYSAYLILQIVNKVIEQHRYPLNIFINQKNVIQVVANLCTINSKILNIEIVKFYKAIIRSKVNQYVSLIVQKNLFFPINKIFVQTYHPVNPPMIQSCIRELFEMIFSNYSKTVNEFFNARLFDYLTHTHQESRNLIKNPKYKDVFQKYDKLNQKEEEDFLQSSKGSQNHQQKQSPSGLIRQDGASILTSQQMIPDRNFFAGKGSYLEFKEFQNDDSSEDEFQRDQFYPKNDELLKKNGDEEIGNLSPIGNPYMKDDVEDNLDVGYFSPTGRGSRIGKAKAWIEDLDFDQQIMIEKQGGSQRSSKSLKDEFQKYDFDKFEHSNKISFAIDCSKSEQIIQERRNQQEQFKEKLLNKRKEQELQSKSILASKTSSNKSKENNYNSIENGIIFERISTSSQGVIDDQELAQDMGIFSGFELNKKLSGSDQKVLSPTYGKRQRTNSFDDQDIAIDKQPLGGIFTKNNKRSESVREKSSSLNGIFGSRKNTQAQGFKQIRNLPFSKIKIERGQKQNSVDDAPKDDTPAPENMHSSGSQSAKKMTSQTLTDQKPKGTCSPSPNDTIKLELTSAEQVLDVESPDEPLVPLSQNRGNVARIKEDDLSENEKEVQPEQSSQEVQPESAPQDGSIIEQENKGNLKRKIEESSIIENENEENLKRQKVEVLDFK